MTDFLREAHIANSMRSAFTSELEWLDYMTSPEGMGLSSRADIMKAMIERYNAVKGVEGDKRRTA